MWKIVLVTIGICLIAGLAINAALTSSHPPGQRDHPTHSVPPVASTPAPRQADGFQQLLQTRLTTTGSQIAAGLPATLLLENVAGETVYARVTAGELDQHPISDAPAAQYAATSRYDTFYTMPVEITVIGIVNTAGTATAPTVTFTPAVLARFSIATHPGADPLPYSNTLTSSSCPGLPQVVTLRAGQALGWCVHAFASATANQPTGGQYATLTGIYQTPVTWTSQRYVAPTIP